ncbi:hypothetical protein BP6252_13199 [Coleophoma cylindrospora]|uniref:Rhodanese domain-containing protein n=1 Tax=Coleophoma cylindrospora TaxID=1849047 RepID=A0A3D8QA53_9HELO|nr:hypothetical protein BP6252_13199 [Coleophoma cylindrospora]
MNHPNINNVYKGPDSMAKYFDPDFQPLLPLVEIPQSLNPLRGDNVRIYAKMMTILPAQNVKALPALNMLEKGYTESKRTIVECSSGSTVTSLSMASRALYQNPDVHAYVSNKIDQSRLRTLQFFGLQVHLYSGPQQPEISDARGEIAKLRKRAEASSNIASPKSSKTNKAQNPDSHVRWTGPQLLKQLPEINIFGAGMGSAGCVTGTGLYLKEHKPSVKVVGICNATGDSIPGPRPYPLLFSSKFAWAKVVDKVEEVNSIESYRLSMLLSREGLICGPSSGMALAGLLQFLQEAKNKGNLQQYADESSGEISCAFLCCDLPYQYLDDYFKKLGEDEFHPIINRSLLSLDTYGYDSKWLLDLQGALKLLSMGGDVLSPDLLIEEYIEFLPRHLCNSGQTYLLDLRSADDFKESHLSMAINLPLTSLTKEAESPFDNLQVLEAQWMELQSKFEEEPLKSKLSASIAVVVIFYTGDTSRMATSILRRYEIKAYAVRTGMPAMVPAENVKKTAIQD